jgi:transposase
MDMVRKKRIPTLWEVPDQLWERIEKLIDDFDPTAPTGRKREDARKILIRRKDEEKVHKERKKKYPARRWVVERTLAWLSKCRGLLVRYEKKSKNYLALLQFACALLWYRRLACSSF